MTWLPCAVSFIILSLIANLLIIEAVFQYGSSKVWNVDYMTSYDMTQLRLNIKKYPIVKRCHSYYVALDSARRKGQKDPSDDDNEIIPGAVPQDWGLLFEDIVKALPNDAPFEPFIRKDLIDCLDIWKRFVNPNRTEKSNQNAIMSGGYDDADGGHETTSVGTIEEELGHSNSDAINEDVSSVASNNPDLITDEISAASSNLMGSVLMDTGASGMADLTKQDDESIGSSNESFNYQSDSETSSSKEERGTENLYWIKKTTNSPADIEACKKKLHSIIKQSEVPVVVIQSGMYNTELVDSLNEHLRAKRFAKIVLTDYSDLSTRDIIGVYYKSWRRTLYKRAMMSTLPRQLGLVGLGMLNMSTIAKDILDVMRTMHPEALQSNSRH